MANESPYGQAVYDTLLRPTPDGTVGPSLATEWKYNDDKTVLTMTLRSDVNFTDGTEFNADAAAQNLIRFRDGNSPNKSYLAALKDAKAIDATHLEITLNASDPALLVYLTQNAGMQESPKAFTAPDIKTNPVGSGPYILDTGEYGRSAPRTSSTRTRTTGTRPTSTTRSSSSRSSTTRPPC